MYFVEDVPYYYHECAEAVINDKGDDFVKEAVVKEHASVMKKTTVAKPEKAEETDDSAQQYANTGDAEAQTEAASEEVVEGEDDE